MLKQRDSLLSCHGRLLARHAIAAALSRQQVEEERNLLDKCVGVGSLSLSLSLITVSHSPRRMRGREKDLAALRRKLAKYATALKVCTHRDYHGNHTVM